MLVAVALRYAYAEEILAIFSWDVLVKTFVVFFLWTTLVARHCLESFKLVRGGANTVFETFGDQLHREMILL